MKDSAKKSKHASNVKEETKSSKKRQTNAPDLPDWLEHGLKDIYRETLDEPLPKEFEDLLDQLEQAKKDS